MTHGTAWLAAFSSVVAPATAVLERICDAPAGAAGARSGRGVERRSGRDGRPREARITLTEPRLVADRGRNIVIRCRVGGQGAALAGISSVVLKIIRPETSLGFTDWASLAFLARLPGAQGLAPRLYGGDLRHRCFVVEDLGPSSSLEDVLRGRDRLALRRALRALARQYARLHAASQGQEATFGQACLERQVSPEPARHEEARRWLHGLGHVRAWFRTAGGTLPDGFEPACAAVAATYADPGPWLGFTHGDPAPTNNHLRGGAVRLLDFEYGAFRHALYDLTAWAVLCPLPEALVQEMKRVYGDELARCATSADQRPARRPAPPPVSQAAAYRQAWGTLVAYRALAMVSWLPTDILVADRSWVDTWGMRAALLTAMLRLARATAALPELAPIARAAHSLAGVLQRRWPGMGEALPAWPVLQD
ncbi:MAG TPA: hypothetical protein VHN78_01215 [Chloroflexota bacterium]|nr:hypothetical protein [Chloroflexota bacterium]